MRSNFFIERKCIHRTDTERLANVSRTSPFDLSNFKTSTMFNEHMSDTSLCFHSHLEKMNSSDGAVMNVGTQKNDQTREACLWQEACRPGDQAGGAGGSAEILADV